MSGMLKLNVQDLLRGAVTAVMAAVIVSLAGVVQQAGFNAFEADWGAILNLALNSAVSAFVGYLGKNLLTDSEGKFLGKIG